MLRNSVLRGLIVLVGLLGLAYGQADSAQGTYCNIFYVTSDNQAVLPFEDNCFVFEEYAVKDVSNVRAVGPIEGSMSLFERHAWVFHFYLPKVRPADRLQVLMPSDFYSKTLKMDVGKFFVTLCDNRSSGRLDPLLDNVDFVAESGSAKVMDYEDPAPGQQNATYSLQMDLRFRQVDRTQGSPKLVGDPIRVRMLVVFEPKP